MGFEVSSAGLEVSSAGLEVSSVGFEVSSAGFEVSSAGFEVSSAGLEVSSVGFDVSSAGFEVSAGVEISSSVFDTAPSLTVLSELVLSHEESTNERARSKRKTQVTKFLVYFILNVL